MKPYFQTGLACDFLLDHSFLVEPSPVKGEKNNLRIDFDAAPYPVETNDDDFRKAVPGIAFAVGLETKNKYIDLKFSQNLMPSPDFVGFSATNRGVALRLGVKIGG